MILLGLGLIKYTLEYISGIIDEREYLKLVPNPNRLPK